MEHFPTRDSLPSIPPEVHYHLTGSAIGQPRTPTHSSTKRGPTMSPPSYGSAVAEPRTPSTSYSSTKRVPREFMTNGADSENGILGGGGDVETQGSSVRPTYSPVPTKTYAPPHKGYEQPLHSDRTPEYLNSFVPLASTPKPIPVDDSAILLGLSPQVQNSIPDGYELVPLDKLTDEYEVVPWNQVQSILNVTNVPGLTNPSKKPKRHNPTSLPPLHDFHVSIFT